MMGVMIVIVLDKFNTNHTHMLVCVKKDAINGNVGVERLLSTRGISLTLPNVSSHQNNGHFNGLALCPGLVHKCNVTIYT